MTGRQRLVRITHWHRHGEDIHLILAPDSELGQKLIDALDYDNTDLGETDDKGNEVLPADFLRAQYIADRLLGANLELRDDEGLSADWGEVRTVSELFLGDLLENATAVSEPPKVPPDPDADEGGVV